MDRLFRPARGPANVFQGGTLDQVGTDAVGWFNRQFRALATTAVESGKIDPLPGWCLSGFLSCHALPDFAASCIRHESSNTNRQYILNASIRDLDLDGGSPDGWFTLQTIAEECNLDQTRLTPLVAAYEQPAKSIATTSSDTIPSQTYSQRTEPAQWDALFYGIDVMTSAGIERAQAARTEQAATFETDTFWAELVKRVPLGRETEFLEIAVLAECIDSFDISYLLVPIQLHWSQKASVKAVWSRFMKAIGKRYAVALSDMNCMEYWIQKGSLSESDVVLVKSGMVRGLAESLDLVDARTFFGFIANVAPDLSPDEGARLLNYSMTRFELHIDNDFGDGPWADWLETPLNTTDAFTGLIWSALGSPLSATRWEAVHTVRRLVEASCEREIDSLFDWLRKDTVGAFGSKRFPFYRLHARLYFLIALARVSLDTPDRLHRHSVILAQLALEGMPHILIQKTAADVALAIEHRHAGTYSVGKILALQRVGHSSFPAKEVEGYPDDVDTPWHAAGQVDKSLNIHFGIDFDSYWFKYLGDTLVARKVRKRG